MAGGSAVGLEAFVRDHTRLEAVPDAGIRLHVGGDIMDLYDASKSVLPTPDPPLPFWAYPWPGGLAIARHLLRHPGLIRGRPVIDVASGSGLCAIVALRQGAVSALAVDIDPLAEAAIGLNARANGVRTSFARELPEPPRPDHVVLAGDVAYEEAMSEELMAWLRRAARAGARVLIGDPGRRYLPRDLVRVAGYRVRTSREIEDTDVKPAAVYTLAADLTSPSIAPAAAP